MYGFVFVEIGEAQPRAPLRLTSLSRSSRSAYAGMDSAIDMRSQTPLRNIRAGRKAHTVACARKTVSGGKVQSRTSKAHSDYDIFSLGLKGGPWKGDDNRRVLLRDRCGTRTRDIESAHMIGHRVPIVRTKLIFDQDKPVTPSRGEGPPSQH